MERAVGLVGGEPKCCKSFLALDLAVAVASGTACLRRYAVARPGPVLLYAAEDALHIVRGRLQGICAAAVCSLPSLNLQVITAPTLRLDLPTDRDRLLRTVEHLRPRLLILDPFVRLHRIDENASGEGAPLLAFLRELQRRYALAVLVVHHAKKGGGRIRAGQALRGSSEIHAWGDSNLYLRRSKEELTLTVEHRAAPSLSPVALELAQRGEALALQLRTGCAATAPPPSSIDERLTVLTRSGQLLRDDQGYRLRRFNGFSAAPRAPDLRGRQRAAQGFGALRRTGGHGGPPWACAKQDCAAQCAASLLRTDAQAPRLPMNLRSSPQTPNESAPLARITSPSRSHSSLQRAGTGTGNPILCSISRYPPGHSRRSIRFPSRRLSPWNSAGQPAGFIARRRAAP